MLIIDVAVFGFDHVPAGLFLGGMEAGVILMISEDLAGSYLEIEDKKVRIAVLRSVSFLEIIDDGGALLRVGPFPEVAAGEPSVAELRLGVEELPKIGEIKSVHKIFNSKNLVCPTVRQSLFRLGGL